MVLSVETPEAFPGHASHSLVLGVDGGGSTTRVVVADEMGNALATSLGHGVNLMDNERWQENLADALTPLDCYFDRVAQACFALPAHNESDAISDAQERFVASLLPRTKTLVVNDVKAAHGGAFAGMAPGVLLLAGTGSMAWAVDARGDDLRFGGWGHVFSDDGSAYWIGREALSLISRIADGRVDGMEFFTDFVSALGLGPAASMDAVLSWYSRIEQSRSGVAALTRILDGFVERGDPNAISLFDRAAQELADLVRAARQRIGASDLPWTYAGGLFNSRHIRQELGKALGAPLIPVLPPVGGSLLFAAEAAGLAISSDYIRRLGKTIPDTLFYQPTDSQNPLSKTNNG
ncbi:N-acetylglucosamine kinase [Mesorhizobium sp. B2-2-2]|nr:N-acetylglucosamine kinase [Mesorhizobium sp. B2-2-2]